MARADYIKRRIPSKRRLERARELFSPVASPAQASKAKAELDRIPEFETEEFSEDYKLLRRKIRTSKFKFVPKAEAKALSNRLTKRQKVAFLNLARDNPEELNALKKRRQYFSILVGNTSNERMFQFAEQIPPHLLDSAQGEPDHEPPVEIRIYDFEPRVPPGGAGGKAPPPKKKKQRRLKRRVIGKRARRFKNFAKAIKRGGRATLRGAKKAKRYIKRTKSNARKLARNIQPPSKRLRRVKHGKRTRRTSRT